MVGYIPATSVIFSIIFIVISILYSRKGEKLTAKWTTDEGFFVQRTATRWAWAACAVLLTGIILYGKLSS